MNDLTKEWLFFANQDLRVAELILPEKLYSQVCFHCQQCVEKCLKSVLAQAGKAPPRIHSIADLLRLMPSSLATNLPAELIKLDLLYTSTRYPGTLPGPLPNGFPGEQVAEDNLSWARQVMAVVEQHVSQ